MDDRRTAPTTKGGAMTGRVVHFEVPYDDAERARGFYGEVFGWKIQPLPEMSYDIVSTGPATSDGMPSEPGYIGGGMTKRSEPVSRPVITIQVDDVAATLARVKSSGGSAVGDPIPVGEMGTAAYFEDSEGNLMGLWQNAG
jgi:predicted enzyme related to lactoylglutathione lyase